MINGSCCMGPKKVDLLETWTNINLSPQMADMNWGWKLGHAQTARDDVTACWNMDLDFTSPPLPCIKYDRKCECTGISIIPADFTVKVIDKVECKWNPFAGKVLLLCEKVILCTWNLYSKFKTTSQRAKFEKVCVCHIARRGTSCGTCSYADGSEHEEERGGKN